MPHLKKCAGCPAHERYTYHGIPVTQNFHKLIIHHHRPKRPRPIIPSQSFYARSLCIRTTYPHIPGDGPGMNHHSFFSSPSSVLILDTYSWRNVHLSMLIPKNFVPSRAHATTSSGKARSGS